MAYHLLNSVSYLQSVPRDPLAFLSSYHYYPPLVYWVTDLFYIGLGSEAIWVAVLSNVVWLGILVFATYGIGRRVWSASIGWISVVFVAAAPIIVSASKDYMLDMPVTAAAALALYLLIRADGFASRRYSLLLGTTVGFGLLVKWTLLLVLLLPILFAVAGALSRAHLHREFGRLLNALSAAAVVWLIAGTWYMHNFGNLAGDALRYNSPGGIEPGSPPVATAGSALYYSWRLLDPQLYFVPTAMALVGIAFCLRKRAMAERNIYPLLMVAGTYVMFSLLPTKDTRFTMPMIPALAVVATSWIEYVSHKARVLITTGFLAYSAVAFLAVSFGTSLLPASIGLTLPSTSFSPRHVTLFAQHGNIIGGPTRENWHQSDPFEIIASYPSSMRSLAYAGPSTIWFNQTGLWYYASRYGVNRMDVARARFLLDRSNTADVVQRNYVALAQWRLPDGGNLVLYEHRPTEDRASKTVSADASD